MIDPSRNLDDVLDVAVRGGRIAAVGRNLASASKTIDARGKLVVPGLIDIHVHARDAALPPRDFLSDGVTTMADAGSRGAGNVDALVEVARTAPNRMRIFLNIARLGNNPGGRGEFLDGIEPADTAQALAAIQRQRNWIVGIKARLSRSVAGTHDLEVLGKAIEVAAPTRLPIMIHMGDTASPLPQILAMLRPGDILTHMYAPTPHGIFDAQGEILPEVRQARRRGILFDFGNGRTEHWNWDTAASGLRQGFPPDTISSDLDLTGRSDQVLNLPNVMSKFLVLGMPLAQVIACATQHPARAIRSWNSYGTLRAGAAADIAVLDLAQGSFEFVDNYKNRRMGSQKLIPYAAIAGGRAL